MRPFMQPNSRILILTVDVDQHARQVAGQALRQVGFDVLEACTGGDALLAMVRRRPALVVFNAPLPDCHSLDLCRRLLAGGVPGLALPAGVPAPQIVFTSSAANPLLRAAALQAGAAALLIRPFELRELVATVQTVLQRDASDQQRRNASRRKDEFMATLAHELRNPLAPIHSAVEILQPARRRPAAALEEARAIIARQVCQLTCLVDDLLDISRIGQGKVTLRRDPVELAATVRAALETVRPAIEKKHHQLSCEFPLALLYVRGDPVRIAQIIGNLLANASKYTPDHGHIHLRVGAQDEDAVVAILDDGIGIQPEVMPHIFELYMQSDAALARCEGGLGIGLPLAKTLAELQGGHLHAWSAGPGRGSEFELRMPRLSAAAAASLAPAPAEHDVAAPTLAPVATPALDASASGGVLHGSPQALPGQVSQRVLLVDDSVDAAEALAILLQASGHHIRTAHDGVSALVAALEFAPTTVILDLGLPRLDGYAVARELRRQPATAGVLLLAVTGYGQAGDRRRTQEAGFDGHFVKPVAFADLEAAIARGRAARTPVNSVQA